MVKKRMQNAGDISLVIPVYNESKVIERVVRSYYDVIRKCKNSEFIVAEDGSNDGTKQILKKLRNKIPFRLVTSNERKGYVNSVRDALKLAKKKYIFFSDSGGGHDPNDFWKLERFIKNYDMVIGYKKIRKDPLNRIILSRGYNLMIGLIFNIWFKDIDCGFRIIKREVIDNMLKDTKTLKYCIFSEFTIRACKNGYKVKECPVQHFRRHIEKIKTFAPLKLPKIIISLFIGLLRIRFELFIKSPNLKSLNSSS
ncbi:glycosyltransferase family 2 protein [Candidatus Woesearchaeota archaeon]|nr:glycosyltransferase family 2 protein [Candidatus Woesearchaeota archaeon]